jgi:cystathionine gamma-synthase
VMGGSIVLNPLSPQYANLKAIWEKNFHNEYFTGDADQLLSNSQDYLERSKILNRNASAMAALLHKCAEDPASPVKKVLYPSVLPDVKNYDEFLRKSTPEFPEPGYGCLMSVDFETLEAARAFYDNLAFISGPHLGAHRSLALCYNTLAFGKHADEAEYCRSFGLIEESVRISAGLEDLQDLVDTIQVALDAATNAGGKTVPP